MYKLLFIFLILCCGCSVCKIQDTETVSSGDEQIIKLDLMSKVYFLLLDGKSIEDIQKNKMFDGIPETEKWNIINGASCLVLNKQGI